MGQNMRAMEQVVGNLENQQLISSEQSQRFMKDYQSNSPYISEVNQFIGDPSLNKFLKYYINCRYWDKRSTISTSESRTSRQSRKELADNLHSLAETQLTQLIITGYKRYQEIIHASLRTLTELLILEKYWMMNYFFVQLLRDCLKVQEFRVISKVTSTIVIYQSATDHLQYMDRKHLLYRQYDQMLYRFKQNQLLLNEDKEISWRFTQCNNKTKQQYEYLVQFSLPATLKLHNYYTILAQPTFTAYTLSLFIRFISYHQPGQGHFSNQVDQGSNFFHQLTEQCCFALDIIAAGFRLEQEMIKLQLSSLLNFPYSYTPSSASQYLNAVNRQETPYNLRQEFLLQIQKTYSKVCKILKSLESYAQRIKQSKIVLDFNRYSQLQFCFIYSHQQLHRKLASCWQQNRIKIIDILGDNSVLLGRLADVSKNQQKCGTISEKHGEMMIKIEINDKHIFDGLTLYLDMQQTSSLSDQTVEVSREERDLPSKIQEKLVKDLEKEDPNVKTFGWLALFVKQHVILEKEKPEPKWQVTDIQRIEGIQNANLDMLLLSEKQLVNWVWKIMKTNSVFNILVNETKNAQSFSNFLNAVQYNYSTNHNPFHNLNHAVNVLHMCYILTTGNEIQQYLTNLDILGVLISGLCHDVSHSGHTNQFELSALNERAMTYNDISPLQNYQASKTFKILKHHANNFLQDLQTSKFLRLKENIIHNILSTDLDKQSELLVKFEQWRNLGKQEAVNQYQTLTAMIVSTSDYAGSCKQFKIAYEWSNLMKQQFQRQVETEKKLGMSTCQIDITNESYWIKTTLSQIETTVVPMYQQISQFLSTNTSVQKLIQNLKNNMQQWGKMSAKNDAKQK